MPRAKCGKSTERTVDFYLTEYTEYYASAKGPIAPRPVHSALSLEKLEAAGFHMPDWEQELEGYVRALA